MRPFSEAAKPRHRALALVVVLAALAYLLIATATTSQAFVTKVGHDTLDDFVGGEFHRTGLLDLPAEDIDSVQLLPVGLFGTWKQDPQTLPRPLTELAAVAAGGHLVVLGGATTGFTPRAEVLISTLGEGGALGPWVEQTQALPQATYGAAAAAYPKDQASSWVYLLGGTGGAGAYDEVYFATLDHASGTTGDWTATEPLSLPVYYGQAIALAGHMYVIGGQNPVFPYFGAVDKVYYAPIQGSGALGAWQETASLPRILDAHLSIAYSEGTTRTLYVIGGHGGGLNSNQVYYADVDPVDGSLSAWQPSEGALPSTIYAHSGVQVADQILVTGGRDNNNTISDTVKAAIIDLTNEDFRLYDWCLGVPPPQCTYGAWQTGPLLLFPRARHVTVNQSIYVYTIGGVGGNGQPTNTVFKGSLTEPGAAYSPWGNYFSPEFSFEIPVDMRKVEWEVTMAYPAQQSLDLGYRYRKQGGNWSLWSAWEESDDGFNEIEFLEPITDVRRFQYRVNLTTNVSTSSPLLNWVDVYYEVADPEVAVRKDTGDVISVTLNDLITYTIYYTNNGEWVAENTVISETVPEHTTYAGSAGWQQVGTSDVYTLNVGNLGRGATGEVEFIVQVDGDVPDETLFITDEIEIDYPPLLDAFNQTIIDPVPANNYYAFSNPYLPYVITITKVASPTHGSLVPSQFGRITYTLSFSNKVRALAAENAYILDIVPEHTIYEPGSIFGPGADDSNPNQLRWDLSTISAGQSGDVGFVAAVPGETPGGTVLNNQATLYSSSGPSKISQVITHTVVVPVYNVVVTKTAEPPPTSIVEPGDYITYTIYYTNAGWIPTSVTIVSDTYDLHESTTFVSADPPPDPGSNNAVWTMGPLASGRKGSIEVVVQVTDTLPSNWEINNQATINSPEGDIFHSNVVTHVVMNPPVPMVDLVVGNIRVIPANPQASSPVQVRATITNTGTLNASTHFWTSVYVRPALAPAPEGPSDHDYGYCLNDCSTLRAEYLRYVGHLDVGESGELIFDLDETTPNHTPFPSAGTYEVYVQADIAFDDDYYNFYWGVYPEEDEGNNIAHITVTAGGDTYFYIPLVFKGY